MILGTAAYTAGLAIHKMEQCGQKPELGEIVVTGASGGVGSMAVALLNRVGYDVLASTGKSTSHEYLKKIGAKRVVSREDVNDTSGRPLLRSKWAGAIDNVGGNTLATLIKACGRNGSVASIGLVDSPNLETTVYPFILNGVNLLGIDSAETPLELRHEIWRNLGGKWKLTALDNMCSEIGLDELISALDKVHRGESVGRIILKHSPHLPA